MICWNCGPVIRQSPVYMGRWDNIDWSFCSPYCRSEHRIKSLKKDLLRVMSKELIPTEEYDIIEMFLKTF